MTPDERRILRIVTACIAVIGLAVVCFNLLYLFVPAGQRPVHGFAPDMPAVYARAFRLPDLVFSPKVFTGISLGLQAAMWGAFFLAVALVRKLGAGAAETAALRRVAIGGVVVALALILTPPALSADLFRYAVFGRMVVTRGLNPYVTPGSALAGDALLALADSRNIPTHYGPVFTGLSVLAAGVAGGGPIRTALAFKVLATGFGALAAWSAAVLARRQGRGGALPLALAALNPLVLIETAGNAHNEMVMMGLAMAGLVMASKGRRHLGFALIIASVHVKWVTAPLAAFVAIAWLGEIKGVRARAREVGTLLLVAVALTVAIYLPFWASGGIVSTTKRMLALGSAHGETNAARLLFLATMAISVVVVARSGSQHVLEMAALACLAFVLFVFPWWLPWYLVAPFTLLAVGPFARLNTTLFALTTLFSLLLMANWALLVPR
jgi:hypothetical protein